MREYTGRTLLDKTHLAVWNARRRELSAYYAVSGVFRGWVPAGFESSQRRVLYVGKATSGEFTGEHVERESFERRSGPFWKFAQQIAKALGDASGDLSCIAWSNVSKLSCPQIRAEAKIIRGFEDKAASTLRYEIAMLRPDVLVFVTNHFGEMVVRSISEGYQDKVWHKSESESTNPREADVWWRRRSDGVAVLWMRHPTGARSELRTYAAEKIAFLARGERS